MKTYSYLLSEKDSNIIFAVIKDVEPIAKLNNTDLINKVGLAVEDEYCYEERVKVIHDTFQENSSGGINIDFKCIDDCGDEEIREFELRLTTIY